MTTLLRAVIRLAVYRGGSKLGTGRVLLLGALAFAALVLVDGARASGIASPADAGLRLLGPWTVDYTEPGVNDNGVATFPLAEGTVVVRAWAVHSTGWTTDGCADDNQIELNLGSGTGSLTSYYPVPCTTSVAGIEYASREYGKAQVVPAGGRDLIVNVWSAGASFTAGSLNVYALVHSLSDEEEIEAGGGSTTVTLSPGDRERLDLNWWGVWALVGLVLVLMIAPAFLRVLDIRHGMSGRFERG